MVRTALHLLLHTDLFRGLDANCSLPLPVSMTWEDSFWVIRELFHWLYLLSPTYFLRIPEPGWQSLHLQIYNWSQYKAYLSWNYHDFDYYWYDIFILKAGVIRHKSKVNWRNSIHKHLQWKWRYTAKKKQTNTKKIWLLNISLSNWPHSQKSTDTYLKCACSLNWLVTFSSM